MGGGPDGPGLSGVHCHMSNSLNTPVEALEHAYPFRVRRYQIRRESGGAGAHSGGDGLVRDIELLTDAEVNLLTERRTRGPGGRAGGADGAPGENRVLGVEGDRLIQGKATVRVAAGEVLSVRSPGGGGWGVPGASSTEEDR